jgi:hypothetical protein
MDRRRVLEGMRRLRPHLWAFSALLLLLEFLGKKEMWEG